MRRHIMKIKCGTCERVVEVTGQVWEFRLHRSQRNKKGHYLGWNCDSCADMIERTGGY